jgi:hypothetical protein
MGPVPDLRQASIRPGDTIVVEFTHMVSVAQAEDIKARLREVWPDNEVVVISGGCIHVIRPEGSDR